MELNRKVIVVTGGASGIGRALARRFAAEKPAGIVVADLNAEGAEAVATEIGGLAVKADMSKEEDVVSLIDRAEDAYGPIDLFCANAGIGAVGGAEAPDEVWNDIWAINVMAHVYAARHLIPRMAARGSGHIMITASAAGLLTNLGAAPYAVTKHAAVGFAEWIAITHRDDGIGVSCLCPQGVRTPMVLDGIDDPAVQSVIAHGAIEPEECAEAVVAGLADESFLILPHPEVAGYFRNKATDYDRWIASMTKLNRQFFGG